MVSFFGLDDLNLLCNVFVFLFLLLPLVSTFNEGFPSFRHTLSDNIGLVHQLDLLLSYLPAVSAYWSLLHLINWGAFYIFVIKTRRRLFGLVFKCLICLCCGLWTTHVQSVVASSRLLKVVDPHELLVIKSDVVSLNQLRIVQILLSQNILVLVPPVAGIVTEKHLLFVSVDEVGEQFEPQFAVVKSWLSHSTVAFMSVMSNDLLASWVIPLQNSLPSLVFWRTPLVVVGLLGTCVFELVHLLLYLVHADALLHRVAWKQKFVKFPLVTLNVGFGVSLSHALDQILHLFFGLLGLYYLVFVLLRYLHSCHWLLAWEFRHYVPHLVHNPLSAF